MQDVGYLECRPAALAKFLVLSRLATGELSLKLQRRGEATDGRSLAPGPPLLPATIASLISALSQVARISLRTAALFIEQCLESVRLGTMVGMGLTRRALIAAVGSARTMHYVARGLEYGDVDQWGYEAA